MAKKSTKIDWRRLLLKAAEDGIKKMIELTILAIILGVAFKTILVSVPAITVGTVIAKLVKIRLIDAY